MISTDTGELRELCVPGKPASCALRLLADEQVKAHEGP